MERTFARGRAMGSNLTNEILNDPLVRNYPTLTDVQVLADLHTAYCDNWVVLSPSELFEVSVEAERQALAAPEKERWDSLRQQAGVETAPGSEGRAEFESIFGVPSASHTNFLATGNQRCTRVVDIQLGRVRLGHIERINRTKP